MIEFVWNVLIDVSIVPTVQITEPCEYQKPSDRWQIVPNYLIL